MSTGLRAPWQKIPEPGFSQQLSLLDPFHLVELEQLDGGSPFGSGGSQDAIIHQGEMVAPRMLSGIEQSGYLPRQGIDGCQVAALVLVAKSAGERKIGGIRFPAMLFGNNVVNLVGKETEFFRHPAVFTTSVSPLVNQAAQGDGDASLAQGRLSCRAARILALRTSCSRY
jgi:hypothetical protein